MDHITLHTIHVQFGHSVVFGLQKKCIINYLKNNVLLVRPLCSQPFIYCVVYFIKQLR